MRFPSILLSSVVTMLCAGCVKGQARNILVERDSGIISMPVTDNSGEERANREKAIRLIELKCNGRKYEITREEEVEVGVVEETVMNGALAGPSSKKLVKSRKAEYRLTYRCQ